MPGDMTGGRIDIDAPRWDQSTFWGRFKHFAELTDTRNAFVTTKQLTEARDLVEKYRQGKEPEGTTEEQILQARRLYKSAFHPDSGELQNFIGRMSFQVPGGMFITAGMMQFYKTTGAVIFWQWMNQSFNVLVNYTNRNAQSSLSNKQVAIAYASATTSAVGTALSLKAILAKRAAPIFQRFVPFAAVAAANAMNIPLSRQTELVNGIVMLDENDNKVTESKYAARKGISQVVFSRIIMAAPGMLVMPVIMEKLESKPWFMRFPRTHLWFQTAMLGVFLTAMVPLACSIFPQRSTLSTETLKKWEPEKYDQLVKNTNGNVPECLYFNKGL